MERRPLALITGASSGMGAEFARQLAARGYDLVLVARRQERLAALGAELQQRHSTSAEVMPADLSKMADIERVAARIVEGGPLNLLVNNAGFGTGGLFARAEIGRQLDMIAVHITAPVRLTRAALPGMIARRRGAVVNVASIVAFMPALRANVSYTASKTYLVRFSEALQVELASTGVRVQALCPGLTHTEFHSGPEFANFEGARLPEFLWSSAHDVVACSLRALERGRVVVIPGWQNRLLAALVGNGLVRPLATAAIERGRRLTAQESRPGDA
jgi:short-subunit dehydrogenase